MRGIKAGERFLCGEFTPLRKEETMKGINWREYLEQAEREAKERGKLLFLFFHHPNCNGCMRTMEETFAHLEVIGLLNREFIPLTYLVTEAQDMVARYRIDWTPTFIVADEDGKELERWVGYLPPKDFLSQISLSEGLAYLHRGRYQEAERLLEGVIKGYPDTEVTPEARYFLGVTHFEESGDVSYLKKTCEIMKEQYPGNSWTKRASVWC